MGTVFVDNLEPQSGTSLTLGANGDTVTLGSGASQSGFGGTNTPNFNAVMHITTQTISANTLTKIQFGDEQWDSDGKYDTSTYRFTPGVAGKYWYKISCVVDDGSASSIQCVTPFKNGTNSSLNGYSTRTWSVSGGGANTIETSGVIELNATDYLEAYVSLETATEIYNQFNTNKGVSQFTSYKIIE